MIAEKNPILKGYLIVYAISAIFAAVIMLLLMPLNAHATKITSIKARTVFEGETIQIKINGKIKEKNPLEIKFIDFVDGVETDFAGAPTVELPSKKSKVIKITAPAVSKPSQPLILEVKRQNELAADAARVDLVVFNKADNASPGPAGVDGVVDATTVTANTLNIGSGVKLTSNGEDLIYNNINLVYKNGDNRRLKSDQLDLKDQILENVAGALSWNGHTVTGPDGIITARSLNDGGETATTLVIKGTKTISLDSNGKDIDIKLPPSGTIKAIATGTYDFDVSGGTAGTIAIPGTSLPKNAIVTNAWYDVITTLSSATDASQVSLGIASDDSDGLLAPIAINHASNPWDAGVHAAIQDGAVANFANKTGDARAIEIKIAGEALTAGKLNVFAEYVISE